MTDEVKIEIVQVHFNLRPVVITTPGDYVTRDGSRVTIYEITLPPVDPTVTKSAASGAVWKMFRGAIRPRGHTIWHICGRFLPLRESRLDIMGPWMD